MSAIDQVEAELTTARNVRWAAERVVRHLADGGQMDWVLRAKIRTLGAYLEAAPAAREDRGEDAG